MTNFLLKNLILENCSVETLYILIGGVAVLNNVVVEGIVEILSVPKSHHEIASKSTCIRPIVQIRAIKRQIARYVLVDIPQVENEVSYHVIDHDQIISQTLLLSCLSILCLIHLLLNRENFLGTEETREGQPIRICEEFGEGRDCFQLIVREDVRRINEEVVDVVLGGGDIIPAQIR